MPKRPSAYFRPQSLQEALKMLAKPEMLPLAGGTRLLAGDVNGAVVDLQDLGIDAIKEDDGLLRIGAMARLDDIDRFLTGFVQGEGKQFELCIALLREGLQRSGPNTFRNAATLGGVLASRPADSELVAALLVLSAQLVINDQQTTMLPAEEYLSLSNVPNPGLITEIVLKLQGGSGSSERVARTPADYPIVSITGWRNIGGDFSLAATGIDVLPVRLDEAERLLNAANSDLNPALLDEAAESAKNQTSHPGDFRGDSTYRAEMAALLTKRVLVSLV